MKYPMAYWSGSLDIIIYIYIYIYIGIHSCIVKIHTQYACILYINERRCWPLKLSRCGCRYMTIMVQVASNIILTDDCHAECGKTLKFTWLCIMYHFCIIYIGIDIYIYKSRLHVQRRHKNTPVALLLGSAVKCWVVVRFYFTYAVIYQSLCNVYINETEDVILYA